MDDVMACCFFCSQHGNLEEFKILGRPLALQLQSSRARVTIRKGESMPLYEFGTKGEVEILELEPTTTGDLSLLQVVLECII